MTRTVAGRGPDTPPHTLACLRNFTISLLRLFHVANIKAALRGLAAHLRGLSVFLDVVYNHLGPEGNYLSDFGPYFSTTTRTP